MPGQNASERERFHELQRLLPARWQQLREDWTGTFDVIVVPSLSLEGIAETRIAAVNRYEERLLFALNLLRHPRGRVIYVTSQPIHPVTIDYTLSLIGGIPASHMRQRLVLFCAYDASQMPLTEKLLARPRLLQRMRETIRNDVAHLACFSVSGAERRLALELGVPLYGVDPDLHWLGSKSGSREVFRQASVVLSPGAENLRDERDVVQALSEVAETNPSARRFAIKHNYGFSGQGNAVLELKGGAEGSSSSELNARIERALGGLRYGDPSQDRERFFSEFARDGGVVEMFIEGGEITVPSGQLRLTPTGRVEVVSTHDQLVAGPDGQVYDGCVFPADDDYKLDVQAASERVGRVLLERGAVGRLAVDFMCRRSSKGLELFALEVNLRLGGTTHPFMLMQMMTDGTYDAETGSYYTKRGDPQFYMATDSFHHDALRGWLVEDLLDIAALRGLHYQPDHDAGVLFHLTAALSEHGKLGFTAIGTTRDDAHSWFERAKRELIEEGTGA